MMEIDEVKIMKKFIDENLDSEDLDLKLLSIQYIIQLVKAGELVKYKTLKSDLSEYKKYKGRDLTPRDEAYYFGTPNLEIYSNGELITQYNGTSYYYAINPEFDEKNRS